MADEVFEYFLTEFPLSWRGSECSAEHENTYAGRLPDALLSYWREFGFSGFGDGQVWLVDPLQWAPITPILLSGIRHPQLAADAEYIPIVRSAFGQVWFWTPGFGLSVSLNPVTGLVFFHARFDVLDDADNRAIRAFFGTADKEDFDLLDEDETGLFDTVLERNGQLRPDEVYGFVPAAALGGTLSPQNASVHPLLAHLVLLRDFMGAPRYR
ncbi:GAD-like domain-containing protein [Tsukamurella sp. NPDC003166]|uniref:GAD-like domain-containing protein n=1 Tax=Tsukamurella sp. NPDC003166 TaxID=3154444 RepID=UPI0033AFA96A